MCQPLDYRELDKETKDRIEIKEDEDRTFYRVIDNDYTDQMYQTVSSRRSKTTQHSYIASMYGCLKKNSQILTKEGYKNIEDISVGELVLSVNELSEKEWMPVEKTHIYDFKKNLVNLILYDGTELQLTDEHCLYVRDKGFVEVKNIVEGDVLLQVEGLNDRGDALISKQFARMLGLIVGDGHIINTQVERKTKYVRKDGSITNSSYVANVKKVRLYNSDESVIAQFKKDAEFEFVDFKITKYKDKNTKNTWISQIQKASIVDEFLKHIPSGRKANIVEVPDIIMRSNKKIISAFLQGLFAADGCVAIRRQPRRGVFDPTCVSLYTTSKKLANQVSLLLREFGLKVNCKVKGNSGSWIGVRYPCWRVDISEYESKLIFLKEIGICSDVKMKKLSSVIVPYDESKIERDKRHYISYKKVVKKEKGELVDKVYDLTVSENNNYVVEGIFSHNSQGSGKSYSSIALCGLLDEKFSADKIFFSYDDLVYKRKVLSEHSAVLMDEQSASFGLDSNRIMIILNAFLEQLRKKSIHMFFCSPVLHPEHQCISTQTILNVFKKGFVEARYVEVGDKLIGRDGKLTNVVAKSDYKIKPCIEVKTDFGAEASFSKEHRVMTLNGLKKAKDIIEGDFIELSSPVLQRDYNKFFYDKWFFYGAFLADGTINDSKLTRISKYTGNRVKSGNSYFLRISNTNQEIKEYLKKIGMNLFKFTSSKISARYIDFYGKDQVLKLKELLGKNLFEKTLPYFRNKEQALGLLNGFANCDSGWSLQENSQKDKLQVSFSSTSKSIARGISTILRSFNIYPVVRKVPGVMKPKHIIYIPSLQVKSFVDLIDVVHSGKLANMNKLKEKLIKKKFNLNWSGYTTTHRIDGKYYAKVLSAKQFGDDQVVDFQIDNEDHLFQLGNGMVTHNSSMYVFEPLFINYKTQEAVAAYKTRELQNLGHVHIPHPVKIVGKDILKAYEEKKDAHLERLTGNKQVDEIEERCDHVIQHNIFKMGELIYLKKRGFIPMNMLMQIVSKIYPEYKQSVICSEIASRIKFNRELEHKWRVAK